MQTAEQVLDRYFLESRCMLIEVAAMLDRHDRANGEESGDATDPRLEKVYQALSILAARNAASNRAERLLMLFSDTEGL